MKSKTHPLVDRFVQGYLLDQFCVAKVDAVIVDGRSKNRVVRRLVIRTHCAEAASRVPDGLSSWDRAQQIYVGNRRQVELKNVKKVWVGPDESWIDFQDFMDWCETEP